MRRSRSPRKRVDDMFSISSLSDYDSDPSRKRYSRERRDHKRISEERYSRDRRDRNRISEAADPSVFDFSGVAFKEHDKGQTDRFGYPDKKRSRDERVPRADKRSLDDRDRGKRVSEKLDHGERRSVHERLDPIEKRNIHERLDFGDTRSRDNDRYNTRREVHLDESKPDDRLNRLEKMLETLVHNKTESPSNKFSLSPGRSHDVMEIMDKGPHFTTSLWLNKINEECLARNFDDINCIRFIQSKMSGLMKVWFKTLNAYDFTWPEIKMLITDTFPDTFDFAHTLRLLVDRLKRPDETITQYYFSKMYLIESCKISGTNAVSCLIDGLNDPTLERQARNINCLTPESLYSEFLVKLPNFGITVETLKPEPRRAPEFRDMPTFLSQDEPMVKNDLVGRKCYTCGKFGHVAMECRHAPICYRCKGKGHIAAKCPQI